VEYTFFLLIATAAAGFMAVVKFGPPLVSVASFTYPNAKFNAMGTPFLQEKDLAKLVTSNTLTDLQNNVVSKDFSAEGDSIQAMQRSIDISLAGIIAMARHDSPKGVQQFYDAFLQLFDARIVKDTLQAVLTETSIPSHQAFSSWGQEVHQRLANIELEVLPDELTNMGMTEVRTCIEQKRLFPAIEYAVDRYLVSSLDRTKVPRTCMRSRDVFVKHLIDVMNLKAIFRTKYYGLTEADDIMFGEGRELSKWNLDHLSTIDSIPEIISLLEGTSYGVPLRDVISEYEEEGPTVLEMALDRTLLHHVENLSAADPMGLGPGIRFLIEKWYEARNLKAIIKGVGEGLDADMIWRVVILA
jgi:V/A-type H+-transporting ATPase subunit C